MGHLVFDNKPHLLRESGYAKLPDSELPPDTLGRKVVFEAGDLLVSYLAHLGVKYVFGVPGGAIEPFYNALIRSERVGGTSAVVSRHEVGAAFMADGYYRNSGNLGVCCATTGPGATNLITGVAAAFKNKVPLLVITAQTALTKFGGKAIQDSSDTGVNTVGMFQFCTGYNSMVSHVDQFEKKLFSALMTAMSHSCPVHLSIPQDILQSPLVCGSPSYDIKKLLHKPHVQDDFAVDELFQQLGRAHKIVLVLGGACYDAMGVILRVASLLRAKIVTTPEGKGVISPYHSLFHGVIGYAGHESARQTLMDPAVDTIVAVGTTLDAWAAGDSVDFAVLNRRLIQVDPPDSDSNRSLMARLHVRGSILSIFEILLARLDSQREVLDLDVWESEQRADRSQSSKAFPWQAVAPDTQLIEDPSWAREPIKPNWLMAELTRRLPPSTQYLADAGSSTAWAIHYLHPFDRRVLERRQSAKTEGGRARCNLGRRRISPVLFQAGVGYSSMGWAIGASIGAALGSPNRTIACITGDGSMLMNGQEITVALQHGLSVVFIVMNGSARRALKHERRAAEIEDAGRDLPAVDFSAMSRSMGVRSFRIACPQDLMNLTWDDIGHNGPTLLDVVIDPDAVPPVDLGTDGPPS